MEAHLGECKECSESFQLVGLANRVMEDEKSMQSNPFLVTRIMANIDKLEQASVAYQSFPFYHKVLKPVLIGFSVAAAMFFGVVMGNISMPTQTTTKLPIEMTYMNSCASSRIRTDTMQCLRLPSLPLEYRGWNGNCSGKKIGCETQAVSDTQAQRQRSHRQFGARASHWLILEFREVSQRRSLHSRPLPHDHFQLAAYLLA